MRISISYVRELQQLEILAHESVCMRLKSYSWAAASLQASSFWATIRQELIRGRCWRGGSFGRWETSTLAPPPFLPLVGPLPLGGSRVHGAAHFSERKKRL
jgi:hypothetical protein